MKVNNVSATLQSNALRRPDRPALIQADEVVSWANLEWRVQHAAGALLDHGVRQGNIVAVSMADTIDQVVIIFALMRLGAVMLPLDVRWAQPESLRVANFFKASMLIVDNANGRDNNIPTVCIDAKWRESLSKAQAVRTWDTSPEDPLLLSLSSGTTGIPKGPMVSHGLYMQRMFYETVTNGTSQADTNMLATPLYFGAGRNVTLMNLVVGATVVLHPPPYQITDLVQQINERNVTSILVVPTIIRRMLALPFDGKPLLPKLRIMMSSAATLHKDEFEAARQRVTPNLANLYATTEAGVVTQLEPNDSAGKAGSVGRPAYLVDVQIADDMHRILAAGEVGRIRYRSLAVPDGFYQNAEETAKAFHDGWYYPGDLAKLDEDGYLYLVGRGKDIITRGGINIHPADIESVLTAHASVVDASVVGWPGGEMGEEVAAFVVVKQDVREAQLIEHCREKLASYKVPKRVFFLDKMPRNEGGKLLKAKLAELLPKSETHL
jgi:acyl-CoA synthetase (AMP-forming)/AMP-acid ligase II